MENSKERVLAFQLATEIDDNSVAEVAGGSTSYNKTKVSSNNGGDVFRDDSVDYNI